MLNTKSTSRTECKLTMECYYVSSWNWFYGAACEVELVMYIIESLFEFSFNV